MPLLPSLRERRRHVPEITPGSGACTSIGFMIHLTIHSAGGAAGEFVSSPPGSRSAAKTITAGTVKVQNAESYVWSSQRKSHAPKRLQCSFLEPHHSTRWQVTGSFKSRFHPLEGTNGISVFKMHIRFECLFKNLKKKLQRQIKVILWG